QTSPPFLCCAPTAACTCRRRRVHCVRRSARSTHAPLSRGQSRARVRARRVPRGRAAEPTAFACKDGVFPGTAWWLAVAPQTRSRYPVTARRISWLCDERDGCPPSGPASSLLSPSHVLFSRSPARTVRDSRNPFGDSGRGGG